MFCLLSPTGMSSEDALSSTCLGGDEPIDTKQMVLQGMRKEGVLGESTLGQRARVILLLSFHPRHTVKVRGFGVELELQS